MSKRKKTNHKKDKKIFKMTAIRANSVNDGKYTPRGGIRL